MDTRGFLGFVREAACLSYTVVSLEQEIKQGTQSMEEKADCAEEGR